MVAQLKFSAKSTLKHFELIMEIIKAHCTSNLGQTTAAKLLLYHATP